MVDEFPNGSFPCLGLFVKGVSDIQKPMHQERKQVEKDKVESKVDLPMAKIVLEMVTMVFEGVERLVFDT